MHSKVARHILTIIAMSLTLSSAVLGAESGCRKPEKEMSDDEFKTCLGSSWWKLGEVNQRYKEWKDAGCLSATWGTFYDVAKWANPSKVSVDCDLIRRRFPLVEAEYKRRNGLSDGTATSDGNTRKSERSLATEVGSPAQGRGAGSAGNTN